MTLLDFPSMKALGESPAFPRATLRQVAEAAGTSAMTVSRVFRNNPHVRPQLRERILKLAEQMGYAPDPHISSVMRAFVRRARPDYRETIAFIGDREPLPHTFTNRVFQGALRRTERLGYRLEPFWIRDQRIPFSRLGRLLDNRAIRGLLLCPLGTLPHMHIRFDWPRFAAVAVGSSLWKPRLNRVQCYHYMAMISALRSLHRVSGDKTGLVISNLLHSHSQGTYISSFLTNQSTAPRDLLGRVHRYATWNRERFQTWVDRSEPEVILCAVPDDVIKVREALKPRWKHIGIACLDTSATMPELAGIDQQCDVIGGEAVNLVLNALQHSELGLPEHPKVVMIEGSWRDGTSLRR